MSNIFNIPASLPFLDSLARGLQERIGDLEKAIIFLPTRRSIFEFRKALQNIGVESLPRIEALGDIEIENFFRKENSEIANIPQAISNSQRIIRLAKLVEKRDEGKSLFQSISVAKSLIALLDELQNKDIPLDSLNDIVAEEFAEYWQITLDFLAVIMKDWAEYKRENNIVEPIERRNLVLKSIAEQCRKSPPESPIIVAGTTGTIPATVEMIASVLSSDKGYLVLRGVDTSFTEKEYRALPENHPQFNLSYFLGSLGVEISQLQEFEVTEQTGRENFISAAMLPIEKIEEWQGFDNSGKTEALEIIDCEDSEEEANVISFIIREAVESGLGDVNIISNNNDLYKKVCLKLAVWNLQCNSSVSSNLAKSKAGEFLISLAEMCESQFSAIKFLSFFKQEAVSEELKEKAREIEVSYLRGLSLDSFLPWNYGIEVEGLEEFAGMLKKHSALFSEIVDQHIKISESLVEEDFFDDEFQEFLSNLKDVSIYIGEIDPLQYSNILRDLLKQVNIWPEFDDDIKINFLSPIEARLLTPELTIIADMNDGSFPHLRKGNDFLNQNMRSTIGLDSADRAVGQQAHDFELLSKQGRVVYTRAQKSGGSPTQKSRFLESLTALAKLEDGAKYKHWIKQFYNAEPVIACEQPKPCPPMEARPKRLSVTKIGTLMRDPYSVYVEKILGLKKLEKIDKDIEASDFGNFVHAAIERYYETPDGDLESLLKAGRIELEKFSNKVGAETFWWPRFKKIAKWIIEQGEAEGNVEHEISASHKIGDFEITAKADRVEIGERIKIIDYKTGIVPKNEDVLLGLEPQLPLEAVIFSSVYRKPIESIEFWSVKGSANEEDKIVPIFCDSFDDLVASAKDGVDKLVKKFASPATPYIARPRPAYALKYNDYEHLARNKEWDS